MPSRKNRVTRSSSSNAKELPALKPVSSAQSSKEDGLIGHADSDKSSDEGNFGDNGMYEDEDEEEEDDDVLVAEVVVGYDDNTASNNLVASAPCLSSVWDSDKVEKLPGGQWKCFHCVPNAIFSGHNATKCLYHVCKEKGKNIRVCNGEIEPFYQKQYSDLKRRHYEKTGRLLSNKTHTSQRISDTQDGIARAIPNKKRNAIQHNMTDYCDLTLAPKSKRPASSATSITSGTTASSLSRIPCGHHQLKLGPNMSNPELTVIVFISMITISCNYYSNLVLISILLYYRKH